MPKKEHRAKTVKSLLKETTLANRMHGGWSETPGRNFPILGEGLHRAVCLLEESARNSDRAQQEEEKYKDHAINARTPS